MSSVTGEMSFSANNEAANYIGFMLRELVLLARKENVRAIIPDLQRAIGVLGLDTGDM